MSSVSLYIPFVHSSLSFPAIVAIFHTENIGEVQRIEWVEHDTHLMCKTCFVYIELYASAAAEQLRSLMGTKSGYRIELPKNRFLKVYENTSEVAKHPIYDNVNITVAVPADTPIQDVYAYLDIGNLGKIAGHYIEPVDDTDLLPGETVPDDEPIEYRRITFEFEYWLRSVEAVRLRASLATDGEYRIFANPPSPVFWRVRISSAPSTTTMRSPYIWFNRRRTITAK